MRDVDDYITDSWRKYLFVGHKSICFKELFKAYVNGRKEKEENVAADDATIPPPDGLEEIKKGLVEVQKGLVKMNKAMEDEFGKMVDMIDG